MANFDDFDNDLIYQQGRTHGIRCYARIGPLVSPSDRDCILRRMAHIYSDVHVYSCFLI